MLRVVSVVPLFAAHWQLLTPCLSSVRLDSVSQISSILGSYYAKDAYAPDQCFSSLSSFDDCFFAVIFSTFFSPEVFIAIQKSWFLHLVFWQVIYFCATETLKSTRPTSIKLVSDSSSHPARSTLYRRSSRETRASVRQARRNPASQVPSLAHSSLWRDSHAVPAIKDSDHGSKRLSWGSSRGSTLRTQRH